MQPGDNEGQTQARNNKICQLKNGWMEKMLEKNGRRPFKMKKTENSEPKKKNIQF